MLDFPPVPVEGQVFAPAGVKGVFVHQSSKWRMLPGLRPVFSKVNHSGPGFVVPLPMGFSAFQIKVAGFNPTAVGSLLAYMSHDNMTTWTNSGYVTEGLHTNGAAGAPQGCIAEPAQTVTAIYLSGGAFSVYGAVPSLPSTYDMWLDPGASTPAMVHASWLIGRAFDYRNWERSGLICGYVGTRGRATDLWVLTNSDGTFTMDSFEVLGVVE